MTKVKNKSTETEEEKFKQIATELHEREAPTTSALHRLVRNS